jgi:D-xylose transport system substrate-binding protein
MVENGAGRIPCILLRPIKVDAENLEEVVVRDGFHRKEDVFG